MAADVDERAEVQLLVSHDDDGNVEERPADVGGEVVADLAELRLDADHLPGAPPDELVLEPGDLRARVEDRRERRPSARMRSISAGSMPRPSGQRSGPVDSIIVPSPPSPIRAAVFASPH